MSIDILSLSKDAKWQGAKLLPNSDSATETATLKWADRQSENLGYVNFGQKTLEDGSVRDVLFTHPKWSERGTIKGWHPWRQLPADAYLEVEVGFSKGAHNTDGVTFQVWEHHADNNGKEVWHKVIEHYKQYTDTLDRISVDLSHLSGQQVGLELRVDAGNHAGQDWACWSEVKVMSRRNQNFSARLSRTPVSDSEQTSPTTEERPRAGHVCSTQRKEVTVNATDHLLLDPQSDFVWPGALIMGSSISTGEYRPALINQKRAPITLSISHPGLSGDSYKEIAQPELATARDAIREFHQQKAKGLLPAKMTAEVRSIYSKEHFNLVLKGHYKTGAHKLTGSLAFDTKTVSNKLLVDFKQVYYTVDVSTPPNRFFTSPVTGNDDITYVSSVTYGRRLLLVVDSTESVQDLKAAIGYSFGQSGNVDLKAKYDRTLKNASINMLVLGGDPNQAAKLVDISSGLKGVQQAVKTYIERGAAGGLQSPPVPLSYKLRYLSDGAIANVILSTNYTLRNCEKATDQFSVRLSKIALISWDDWGEIGEIAHSEELYGSFEVRTYARPGKMIERRVLWNTNRDQYIALHAWNEFKDKPEKMTAASIGKEERFTFKDFHKVKDTGYIEVLGTIKERDWVLFDFEGVHDDLYGRNISHKIPLSEAIMPSNFRPDKRKDDGTPDNSPGAHPDKFKLKFQSGHARVEIWFEVNPV